MTYQQTLDYLFSQLPMFQRVGAAAYKADLNNTIAICRLLDNPENKFRSVHVAGTNGKGSTSHMIASVLQSAGFKVGLYTSPHLKDFRERIRINGEMIPEKNVIDFVEKYKSDFEKIKPSFFEMTVGLAFNYFAEEKVDIAVIEVGLGGRLDSTNVITPLVSVITNISFDHVALLGDTIEKIAVEKAGIIKDNVPVVIGETQELTKDVFTEVAEKHHSEIVFADQIYSVKNVCQIKREKICQQFDVEMEGKIIYNDLETDLLGSYQKKNILTVFSSIDQLNKKGFSISENSIREGMRNVIKNTGLLCRWQIFSTEPLIIADTGHNEAGIKEVLEQISNTPHKQLHFVIGMVNDKDVSAVLGLLSKDAIYYFCKASIPRALDAKELADKAKTFGLNGSIYNSVLEALDAAKQNASPADLIFIGGSTFTVADLF
jgi:dihydrofolate synthase / folylpolyglutamate synthase